MRPVCVQDIAVEYATALAQSAMDRTATGKAGKLQAEDVLFIVRKVKGRAVLHIFLKDVPLQGRMLSLSLGSAIR